MLAAEVVNPPFRTHYTASGRVPASRRLRSDLDETTPLLKPRKIYFQALLRRMLSSSPVPSFYFRFQVALYNAVDTGFRSLFWSCGHNSWSSDDKTVSQILLVIVIRSNDSTHPISSETRQKTWCSVTSQIVDQYIGSTDTYSAKWLILRLILNRFKGCYWWSRESLTNAEVTSLTVG